MRHESLTLNTAFLATFANVTIARRQLLKRVKTEWRKHAQLFINNIMLNTLWESFFLDPIMGLLPLRSLLSMVITRFVVDGTGLGWDIFQSNGFFEVGGARTPFAARYLFWACALKWRVPPAGTPRPRVAKPCHVLIFSRNSVLAF